MTGLYPCANYIFQSCLSLPLHFLGTHNVLSSLEVTQYFYFSSSESSCPLNFSFESIQQQSVPSHNTAFLFITTSKICFFSSTFHNTVHQRQCSVCPLNLYPTLYHEAPPGIFFPPSSESVFIIHIM